MQEQVVLYIPNNLDNHPSWVVFDKDNQILQAQHEGAPSGLAEVTSGRKVTVVVPSESLAILKANMPKMNAVKLMKALPFAIEEELIDDVANLHFALSPQGEMGDVMVVAVNQQQMQDWLQWLDTWGVQANRMIPLVLSLPIKDKTWAISAAETLSVRIDEYDGFVCDRENADTYLSAAISERKIVPEVIDIIKTTRKIIGSALKVTAEIKETLVSDEKWLTQCAPAAISVPSLDLLQGAYSAKKSRTYQGDKLRKIAIGLVVASVVLIMMTPFVSTLMLSHRNNQLLSSMRAIYSQQFPSAKRMIAPKMRLTDKLQQTQAQLGQNRLLLLLGYLGQGLSKSNGIKLKQLRYQGSQVTIELTATNSDDFSSFSDYLTNIGLNVEQQNAVLSGSRINATLVIG